MRLTISPASLHEAEQMIALANAEGWNPGLHDAKLFHEIYPQDLLIGKLNGELVAVASAARYDEHFAFFGLYIVKEPYRGQGYGWQLTQKCLQHIGNRNFGLDGVVQQQATYAKIGFKFAYRHLRFKISAQKNLITDAVTAIDIIPWPELLAYDTKHFPAERSHFLNTWIKQPAGTALAYIKNKKLIGYGVIRACQEGYKIGPLFAETFSAAEALLLGLLNFANPGEPVFIDIPEININALKLASDYQMHFVFETARMYTQTAPALPIHHIYGVTTLELG